MHLALLALDEGLLKSLEIRSRVFEKGTDIYEEGRACRKVYIVTTGWACSYKIMRSGSRQVIDFKLPGDIIGLQALNVIRSGHSCFATTRVETAEINTLDLIHAFTANDRLATSILGAASRDDAMLVERLVSVGRRSALERTAHFFLELAERLALRGMGSKTAFDCPLSQFLIADSLGLTAVHLNRMLRTLREMNLLTFHEGHVHILDQERLTQLADFENSYLE